MSEDPDRRIWNRSQRTLDFAWLAAFGVVAVWVFYRLGAFDLWNKVTLSDGTTEAVVNTFAAVDHPFHASRAEILRRAIGDGGLLRWISAHQGGYPVEFYPLGAPAFEVLIWASMLGWAPMMAAHKVAVIVIFLLPAAGFFLLARADRVSLGIGLLALVLHLCARGWWWSGGYSELIEWGLVSSSLAMASLVLLMPMVYLSITRRSIRWSVIAGAVGAFCIYTNVRSILPMVAIGIGLLISLCWNGDRWAQLRSRVGIAVLLVAVLMLLAAPLLIALIRFSDLYYFVTYERYDSLREYWHASITAVSSPVFSLALVGCVTVAVRPELRAGRFVASTLGVYIALTVALSGLTVGPTISQLEATRLMPFQRALTIYLAALGVYGLLVLICRVAPGKHVAVINGGLTVGIALTLVLYIGWDDSPIPVSDRAFYPVLTTGQLSIVDQQRAIELADQEAEPGTAILVLGTTISWHDQFWSMEWSERPFFFNDWLWYWQQDLPGEYDPATEHSYPDPLSTLSAEFLENQGVGAVVVAGSIASPDRLERISQDGAFSVYLVRDPTPIVTAENAETTSIDIENQRFTAIVSEPASSFHVRRNWFPRWTASVDGEPASISKGDDGFMIVTAEAPGTEVVVTYGVDGWDWVGRLMLFLGVAIGLAALAQPSRFDWLVRGRDPIA